MSEEKKYIHSESLRLYEIYVSKLSQEGDATWTRFNIMIAINFALFISIYYIFFSSTNIRDILFRLIFTLIISVAGLLFSICSLISINNLWKWNRHWEDILFKLEKDLKTEIKPYHLAKKEKITGKEKKHFKFHQIILKMFISIWGLFLLFDIYLFFDYFYC